MRASPALGSCFPFNLLPNRVELLQTRVAEFPPRALQSIFHFVKTRDEFIGRSLKQTLSLELAFPRQVHFTANSESPISSAIIRLSAEATAVFVSSNSSSTLAITSLNLCQSKFTRAAFFCAFSALINAGSAFGKLAR